MLSREDVLKIARLARLELSDGEVEEYQRRLGRVLDYMKDLESLNLSKGVSTRHVPEDAIRFRDDLVREWPHIDRLLANAPASDENHFLLPIVVEKGT